MKRKNEKREKEKGKGEKFQIVGFLSRVRLGREERHTRRTPASFSRSYTRQRHADRQAPSQVER